MKKKILLVILFVSSNFLFSQLSDLHILPPLKQNRNNQSIEKQAFYISTPEVNPFTVDVFIGNSPTPVNTLTVSNAAPVRYDLADGDNEISLVSNANTGIILTNSGLRFQSPGGEEFYVNYRGRSRGSFQAASLTAKGRKALGTKFKWGGIPNRALFTGNQDLSSVLGIMATEDNTEVTISNYNPGCSFRLADDRFGIEDDMITIMLNRGQSFVLEAIKTFNSIENEDGWLGADITASKDIAISNGGLNVGVNPALPVKDAAIDQPVPEDVLGDEYVFIRGNGVNNTEFPIIIAIEDGTDIFVNGAPNPIATINNGEYFEIPGNNYNRAQAGGNMYVNTSKNVYAYQVLAGAVLEQTISLNFLAPVNCLLPRELDNIADFTDVANLDFLNGGLTIITSTLTPDADLQVRDNGGLVPLPAANIVDGNPDWKTFFVTNITGNISVQSSGPIAVGFLGASSNAGIAGHFSGFDTIINVELDIAGATCIPGAELLEISNQFDTYQWFNNDVLIPGANTSTHIPTVAGTYHVEVTKSGCPFISETIEVEIITINPTDDLELCDDVTNDGVENFNLEVQTPVVLGTQPAAENIVTYHLSFDDANQGINPLISPYANIANPQPIFVRIERVGDNLCANVSNTPAFNLIVNPREEATFTFVPSCDGGTATITGTQGGVFSFNPIPNDGAVIDAATGEITNGVPGTTYTVEYTTQGACSNSSTQMVTLLEQDDASFNITPGCDGGTAIVTGAAGGVFSFNPIPNDGAVIDAATGEITNGVPGTTYTVEYTTQGACANSSTQMVTLLDQDDASFNITPGCDGSTAIITGTAGGVFSFNPIPNDGAVIDAATGEITNGVPGTTYTVEYTTQGACANSSTQMVTLLDQDDASFNITPGCDGGTAIVTGTAGGVFSFNPIPNDGAVIDAATGEITNGVPGTTYTVEYITQGPCPDNATQTVTLLDQDDASFNITPGCDGSTSIVTGTAGGVFSFNPIPNDGAVIDAATGEITNGVPGTTYTVAYTTQGACANSSTQTVTLLDQDDASFNITPGCGGSTAIITGATGGVFSFNPIPNDGAVIDVVTGEITNGVPGTTYTVAYTTQGACANSSTQTVTLLDQDDASFNTTAGCGGSTAIITGTAGGVFSFNPIPNDGAVIDAATGEITNGVPGTTYTIVYTTQGACPDTVTQAVTLLDQDDASFNMSPGCDRSTAIITGTAGGVFSFNPIPNDGAVIDAATGEITNGVPGTTYTVEYITQGPCPDNATLAVTLLDQDNAAFSITPTCTGGTAIVTGTLGGIFSFNPIPNDGAVIDAATGEITNGVPGTTYTVEYATQGMCSNSSIVTVQTLPPGNALFSITPTCDGGEVTVSGNPGGVFSFDPVPNDGAMIDATTGVVTNGTVGTTYTISYTVNNCFAVHNENLTILPQPPIDSPEPLTSCDDITPGAFAFFDLESKDMEILEATPYTTVTYHDTQLEADNGTNPLISPYFSDSRIVFVRAQELACYSTTTLELEVISLPEVIAHTYALCDDNIELDNDPSNDSTTFNLPSQNPILLNGQDPTVHTVSYYSNQADANSGTNPLPAAYTNTINPQTIYVRIENRDTLCFITGELILQVNPLPVIEIEDEYVLCLDSEGNVILPTPIIDTGLNTAEYAFEWYLNGELINGETNGTISIMESGDYSVTATHIATGCSASENTIVVESATPVISAEQVSITFVEDNTIFATATNPSLSNALFEFKIDDGPWVSNIPNDNTYTFENVPAGSHTITARDIEGCGEASITIIVLDFIPYFTPNGDGFHDTWNIIGLENQPDAKLYVFDRYGKLLKQLSPSGNGWDGTFNNNLMPTSDYWFTLQYKDPNTDEPNTFKAHFTLKR